MHTISWVDITTGEFFSKTFSGKTKFEELCDSLVKISPVEIISNKKAYDFFNNSPLIEHGVLVKFSLFTESEFNITTAYTVLKEQFNVQNLSSFSINFFSNINTKYQTTRKMVLPNKSRYK